MTTEELIKHIRVIPDFPTEGIMFQDITTLFLNGECLREISDRIYEEYRDKGITKVVGLESRGFLLGSILAYRLGAGFVMARKKGKLPAETVSEYFDKEYGHDCIEMHTGSIGKDDVVLLTDDLLATGGTIAAAYRLVQRFKPKKTYVSFVIDLIDCPRRDSLPEDVPVYSVLHMTEHPAD